MTYMVTNCDQSILRCSCSFYRKTFGLQLSLVWEVRHVFSSFGIPSSGIRGLFLEVTVLKFREKMCLADRMSCVVHGVY